MRTRQKFLKRGLLAASMLTLTCCTAAEASTAPPPPEAHQVGSQSFAFAAGNAAAYQQQVNEYVLQTTAAQNAAQAPPQKVRAQASSGAVAYHGDATGSVNGYPCGGDLPPCYVLLRESRGNPTAQNRSSSASGLWQFLDSTWAGFGGYARAMDAPPDVQNEKARILWNGGAGCSHWSAC